MLKTGMQPTTNHNDIMATTRTIVFYGVTGGVTPDARLVRGIFARRADACTCAEAFPFAQVWRHVEECGKRVESKIIKTKGDAII